MKIQSLQISNILSFAHYENIADAPVVRFDEGLNILIGQNGAGKSTVLEVINFVFRRVVLPQFQRNQDLYDRRSSIQQHDVRQIITRRTDHQATTYGGFRLDPNWNSPDKPQRIVVQIALDEIDEANMGILRTHASKIGKVAELYSNEGVAKEIPPPSGSIITIDITLNRAGQSFSSSFVPAEADPAVQYLVKYNLFRELIDFHNIEHTDDPIPGLFESFSLIGSYRNYHAFTPSVSLQSQSAALQIQALAGNEFIKSTNASEQAEPAIFSLVRLRLAEKHYSQFGDSMVKADAEQHTNEQEFLRKINEKLQLVNLRAEVSLTDKRTWSYAFAFVDTKREKTLTDLNSLSAGQKAIIHLVFEAYGRGELRGGVVVIDEPEIHLHYQFQHEYLRIIEDINKEQKCQYILVTHSESLINSKTIGKVRRLALDEHNRSQVRSPVILEDQKSLVKILDNTRSTYAFFAKKVVLVEGDTDRYLFKAILQHLKPELDQEVAVLDIGGKGNYPKWKGFFESFGLAAYYVGDFDNVFSLDFPEGRIVEKAMRASTEAALKQEKLDSLTSEQQQVFSAACTALFGMPDHATSPKLAEWKPVIDRFLNFVKVSNAEVVARIRGTVPDIDAKIEAKYDQNVFILKAGAIEEYVGGPHGDLNGMAGFCESGLKDWLSSGGPNSQEVLYIIEAIAESG
jgi:predicted ATP-dependent endonuclease of OLD family